MTGDARSRTVCGASGATWEIDTVVAPASWATGLVGDDWSGLKLEPTDAKACRAWLAAQHADGWRVIDVARYAKGSPEGSWFSRSADLCAEAPRRRSGSEIENREGFRDGWRVGREAPGRPVMEILP